MKPVLKSINGFETCFLLNETVFIFLKSVVKNEKKSVVSETYTYPFQKSLVFLNIVRFNTSLIIL